MSENDLDYNLEISHNIKSFIWKNKYNNINLIPLASTVNNLISRALSIDDNNRCSPVNLYIFTWIFKPSTDLVKMWTTTPLWHNKNDSDICIAGLHHLKSNLSFSCEYQVFNGRIGASASGWANARSEEKEDKNIKCNKGE